MKLRFKMAQATASIWAAIYATISRWISIFDLRDWTFFLANVVSLTSIISILSLSIYNYSGKDPSILMISILILSMLFSFTFLILFRINLPSNEGFRRINKLAQNLHHVASIRDEVTLENSTSDTASSMSARYPASLVRVFTVGVGTAACGLLAIAVGAFANNAEVQFGGSTALAVGCVALTLAVFQGENLDQRSF